MAAIKQGSVRLSSKGQLVIPRNIREKLQWRAGMELTIVPTGNGVTLWPKKKDTGKRLESLRGCLAYQGPRVLDADLDAPVDYADAWRESESPDR